MQFQWKQLGVVLSLVWWLALAISAQTPASTGPRNLNDILALDDPSTRVTALQQFLKANPNGDTTTAREALVASYAQIGETQLGENNIEKAVDTFQRAIKALPKQVSDRFFEDTVVKIPMAVSTRGYRAEAVTLGKLLEARFNNEAARLAALGEFYLTIEASGEAIHTLEDAVQLTPEDARLHRALGAAYRMGLRIDDAVAAYQLAVRYDAKDRRAYYDLANLYRSQGAYDDALKLYRKQLEIEPKHSPSYKGLALCYTALGKDDQAAAALNQVRDLRGSSDEITQDILLQTQLAFYLLAQGKVKAARQAAEAALLVEPRFSWARIAAAEVELAEQKFFEAERHLLAAQQFANFPTLSFTLGKVYLIVEDFDGAAEQFAKAFKYSANDKFTTRLGGVRDVQADELKELFAPEHQAAIFLAEPPTSDELFKIAESLVRTNGKPDGVNPSTPAVKETGKESNKAKETKTQAPPEPEGLESAVNTFVEAEGSRRSFRALYMAHRLAQAGKALPLAIKLSDQALERAEIATEAEGSVRDFPNYDREGRLRLFRGRALDTKGWALFKANRNQAALGTLSEAVTAYGPLPERNEALRHLAAAQEAAGNLALALEMHLAAYEPPAEKNSADVNRTVIEVLYRKVHGSLDGLREKLGQPLSAKTTALIANTARLAATTKPAEPVAQTAKTATTKAPANADFNVNQLLANKAAEPTAERNSDTRPPGNQSGTRPGSSAATSARPQPNPNDSNAKEPVRLGLYGIPVNPNTSRVSVPRPSATRQPASPTVKEPEPRRESSVPNPPASQPNERVASVSKELPLAPNRTTSPQSATEEVAVNKGVEKIAAEENTAKHNSEPETQPATTAAKSAPNTIEPPVSTPPPVNAETIPAETLTKAKEPLETNAAAKPESKPEVSPTVQPVTEAEKPVEVKPVLPPVQLPELSQPEWRALPVTSATLVELELFNARLNLPALDEPPAPTPLANNSVSVRYETAPVAPTTETPAPAPPASTRPRRVSELVPVNEPAPTTRKRRVTPGSPKP